MKLLLAFLLGAFAGAAGMMLPALARHVRAHFGAAAGGNTAAGFVAGETAHTEKTFEFVANGPMEVVAPVFGAWKEREWAPGWNPQFVWPSEPSDRAGMVFQVAHRHTHAVWVNTAFDLKGGRIQYAYVIPDAMVTLITLRLTPQGGCTHVAVEYERTALDAELNAHVQSLAEQDAKAGPEWERQINEHLGHAAK